MLGVIENFAKLLKIMKITPLSRTQVPISAPL